MSLGRLFMEGEEENIVKNKGEKGIKIEERDVKYIFEGFWENFI